MYIVSYCLPILNIWRELVILWDFYCILVTYGKSVVPLLKHWWYHSLALSRWFMMSWNVSCCKTWLYLLRQVSEPSVSSPSWIWWTRGQTLGKSWRTNSYHCVEVSGDIHGIHELNLSFLNIHSGMILSHSPDGNILWKYWRHHSLHIFQETKSLLHTNGQCFEEWGREWYGW